MKIQSLQHAINRKAYLERILAQKPPEAVYMGNSYYAEDAVNQENKHNEILAENISAEIKNCKKFIN